MAIFSQVVGWAGAFLVIFAYILISLKKVDGGNKGYQFMNLIGVTGVAINCFYQRAWPSFTIQFIWGVVAILALIKIYSELKKQK